jgi:hypothetical protein
VAPCIEVVWDAVRQGIENLCLLRHHLCWACHGQVGSWVWQGCCFYVCLRS